MQRILKAPMMLRKVSCIATLLVLLPVVSAVVTLRPVSTIYLPYSYNGEEGLYGIDAGAVEQTGYDSATKIGYSAGDNYIHITDWSDVTTPTILERFAVDTTCNDIETCGDFVGFVLEGPRKTDDGTLHVYSLYDKASGDWTKLHEISLGSKPDMLHFSHDCRTIVVANEGEAAQNADQTEFINREGSISIIRLSVDGSTFKSTLLNFTQFNDRSDEYVARGVRYPYHGELDGANDTFAQNLEPEYITYNYDDTKAFVGLQENNAIAVVDLLADEIEDIYPLGEKSWLNLDLDASDRDDGIIFRRNDIFSIYQPDSIKYFEVDGVGYIITTNEGEFLEYELGNEEWAEDQRGNDFKAGDFAETFDNELIAKLDDDDILGRLGFSKVDGLDSSGKFEKLYFFGARGFSIFRASDIALVYDSGDEVAKIIAKFYPDVFSTDTNTDDPANETPEDLFDKRSDNQGPECESVEIGELGGRRIIFVGIDRTSAILVYSLESGEVVPTFESVYRAGGRNDTFQNLLDDRNLGDLDPDDLKFIPASASVTGVPMLMVTSSVSGTVSLYEVYDDSSPTVAQTSGFMGSRVLTPYDDRPITLGGRTADIGRCPPDVYIVAESRRMRVPDQQKQQG
ncbi:mesenchyme-specific cell surface glycoprotein-like [Strongylocentrotus purpuratus]|uniref:Choice-of-anchor I domain-containing protein n=1 Tax=Strongylocentrotus purpuratus TaxID=7668 RepID=A0A7M7NYR7_STRPU|nr:mesenchyme-specific cell surface glycoprotein-like [Strongylocentrotus purpuratus]